MMPPVRRVHELAPVSMTAVKVPHPAPKDSALKWVFGERARRCTIFSPR